MDVCYECYVLLDIGLCNKLITCPEEPYPAEIVGSNPTGGGMDVCYECYVLLDIGLCNELITYPEKPYPAERVGLNPIGGMDVCYECCVLLDIGLCNELITCPEEPYELWCIVCALEPLRMMRPWPTLCCSSTGKKSVNEGLTLCCRKKGAGFLYRNFELQVSQTTVGFSACLSVFISVTVKTMCM
jgi:hypothetical protein